MTCVIKVSHATLKKKKKKQTKTKAKTKKIFKIYYINFQHKRIEFFFPQKIPGPSKFSFQTNTNGNLFFFIRKFKSQIKPNTIWT